ncbi:uncharacterized protein LOC8059402 [Sorghum bicolor]|uniref:uncharacterized protein LOC8059402 n=1 Tax=Sorghum bicolor TaxID=4558 RepID=UPI00081ADAC7|nr:uncharacterized protein LOC8059402 [Sorghum bicolor]|eukprot:XP_002459031.2 uncharacterized protein LOC8059402 [Sorghum bicolor]
MDSMAALPKDPLIEIFSRVDNIKDLFMFAVTCRWWLHRFTDPAFLHELCRGKAEDHHVHLLGFFFHETTFKRCKRRFKCGKRQNSLVSVPTFFPTPGSPLGPTGRSLTSFFATVANGTFTYAEPLVARHGIILMNLIPRTFRGAHHSFKDMNKPLLVGLCNPISGEHHVLPPLEFSANVYFSSFAIITAADNNNEGQRGNMFSQLLVISRCPRSDAVYLHSYSTSTCFWSAPTKCLDKHRLSMLGGRSAVIHQGMAHWLCVDYGSRKRRAQDNDLYKLSVEVGTTHISLTKLPIRDGGLPVLCVNRDNKLFVACIYLGHVTIWTQQEDGEEEGNEGTPTPWLHTVIRIPAAVLDPNYRPLWQGGARWYHFNKGSLLVVYDNNSVFVLDLEEKVMEKVKDCLLPQSDNQGRVFVPYQMGLVDFFGSRRPAFLLDDLEA